MKEPKVNNISTLPIKDYDIVPDIWNHHATVTIGELLVNEQYRNNLFTAIHMMKNRSPTSKAKSNINQIAPIKTTALTMKIKINGRTQIAVPDSEASLSIISESKAKELGLAVQVTRKANLSAYENPLQMVEIVEQAPIFIGTAKIPLDLQIVNSDEETILLGMDWFMQYEVNLNVPKKELDFTSEGERFKTYVTYKKVTKSTINYVIIDELSDSKKVRQSLAERLSTKLMYNVVDDASLELDAIVDLERLDEAEKVLKKFLGIEFTDEKQAT